MAEQETTLMTQKEEYLIALAGQLRSAGNEATAAVVDTVLAELRRSHWYEMSVALLAAIRDPMVLERAYELHEHVLGAVRADISPVAYVKLIYCVCFSPQSTLERAMALVESAFVMFVSQGETQCTHAVQCIRALLLLGYHADDYHTGASVPGSVAQTVRRLLDAVDAYLQTLRMHEVEPLLTALRSLARGREYELRRMYTEYYKNAFDIVTYMEKAEMPLVESEVTALAYKAAMAALLSESVFNFGKLLNFTGFVTRLAGNEQGAWLLQWLHSCNEGDVRGFEKLYEEHAEALASGVADLANATQALARKVRLMALLHLVFYTPFAERVFAFGTIAERCCVPEDEAEPLLLAALAQGIIRGSMDGMTRQVHVTWVQPRVLSLQEVQALTMHVSQWRERVEKVHKSMQSMTAATTATTTTMTSM